MPHEALLLTYDCTRCHQLFRFPWLGESTYGEVILHGERGGVHRYVWLIGHPAWDAIDAVLRPRKKEFETMAALAAVADPVDGQRFRLCPVPVCPHCQADAHFRVPESAPETPPKCVVNDATFSEFLSLPPAEQRRRVLAAVGEA